MAIYSRELNMNVSMPSDFTFAASRGWGHRLCEWGLALLRRQADAIARAEVEVLEWHQLAAAFAAPLGGRRPCGVSGAAERWRHEGPAWAALRKGVVAWSERTAALYAV